MRSIRILATTLTFVLSVYFSTSTADAAESKVGTHEDASELSDKAVSIYKEAEGLRIQYTRVSLNTAIPKYFQTRDLAKQVGDRKLFALATNNLAVSFAALGERDKALELYLEVLPLWRQLDDRFSEATTMTNIARVYTVTGQYGLALDYLKAALPIRRTENDEIGELYTLNAIGAVYYFLGDYDQQIQIDSEGLSLSEQRKHTEGISSFRSGLGLGYEGKGDMEKALEYLKAALRPLSQHDHALRGVVLNNLAWCERKMGRLKESYKTYMESLAETEEAGDRISAATTLNNLGQLSHDMGDDSQAFQYLYQALDYLGAIDDLRIKAKINATLADIWKSKGNTFLAILYGKLSINNLQTIRGNLTTVESRSRESFVRTNSSIYRDLADLLIAEDRLTEAQQVLNLLKVEEYSEYLHDQSLRGADPDNKIEFSLKEQEWEKRFADISGRIAIIAKQYAQLRRKKLLTSEDKTKLAALHNDLIIVNRAHEKVLEELAAEAGSSDAGKERIFDIREARGLSDAISELGEGTIALYTLTSSNRYRVILITPEVQIDRMSEISAADLGRKVLDLRIALQSTLSNPEPLARELYDILIKPIENDLETLNAKTLMWSLDGVLRYLPISALHDGKKYFVERYRNVVFTPASRDRLKDKPASHWKGLGFGVSKEHEGFKRLHSVRGELNDIIKDIQSTSHGGLMPGKILLDETFTENNMVSELQQQYSIVHIASHFVFNPISELKSFLLLGDDTRLSIDRIKVMPNVFRGIELLTLSTCNTATGGATADGKEVEGFAVLAQRQGAKGILATLWPVFDTSTRLLMQKFYQGRLINRADKAKALQDAQLYLLKGDNRIGKMYSHPFYWAPFTLIGNWQ